MEAVLSMELQPRIPDGVCPNKVPEAAGVAAEIREVSLPETPEGALPFVIASEGKNE